MVTSVPLSIKWDWDLLAKMPREVMYTEAAERKRRRLWAGVLIGLALTILLTQIPWGGPADTRLIMTAILAGLYSLVALGFVIGVESALAEQYALLKNGVPYVATIIERCKSESPYYPYFTLKYCFVAENGAVVTGVLTVPEDVYEKWELDAPFIVLVDPTTPHRYQVYDLFSDVALKP